MKEVKLQYKEVKLSACWYFECIDHKWVIIIWWFYYLFYKPIDLKNSFLRIFFFRSNTNSTRYNILSPPLCSLLCNFWGCSHKEIGEDRGRRKGEKKKKLMKERRGKTELDSERERGACLRYSGNKGKEKHKDKRNDKK